MKTIAQRVKWAMDRRGLNKNQLEAGPSEGALGGGVQATRARAPRRRKMRAMGRW